MATATSGYGTGVNESLRLGRIAGVAVGLNWSLLAIFALITVSLAAGRFPVVSPDRAPGTYLIAGLVTALLFFLSVLAHEISHAVVARRNGIEVDGIVLWLFGGVARLRGDASTPGVAFRIAAVGPLVSFLLGGAFLGAALGLGAVDGEPLAVEGALWLGVINVILAVFNLFPGAPLDGGRVLRSILWAITGDKYRSWVSAARAGRVLGFVVIGLGLLQFAAIGIGGLWLVLIGWFLVMAASTEEQHALLQHRVGDATVRDVMSADPVAVPSGTSASAFLDDYVFHHRFSTFPVTTAVGKVVGLATVNGLKEVAPKDRTHVIVDELATPIDQVPVADPDEQLTGVIERLDSGPGASRLLVLDDGHLVGIVSPIDIMRLLELQELARPRRGGPPPPPPPRS